MGASVGGTGVSLGIGVSVGGSGVLVGGTAVWVGGIGVLVAVGERTGMNGTEIISPAVISSGLLMQFANCRSLTINPKILLKL